MSNPKLQIQKNPKSQIPKIERPLPTIGWFWELVLGVLLEFGIWRLGFLQVAWFLRQTFQK